MTARSARRWPPVCQSRGQSRGSRGGPSRLLHALAQRLEVADEAVDVVRQGGQLGDVPGVHRQLDGASGGLVEARVDQAELVLRFGDRLVHALGRTELRLERLDRLFDRTT